MKNFSYHTTAERAASISRLNLPNNYNSTILELRKRPTIGLEIEKQNQAAYDFEEAPDLVYRDLGNCCSS